MKLALLLVALAVLTPSAVPQAPAKPEQAAQKSAMQAADSWLALVDAGKYAESWQTAAELFKTQVTQEQWQTAANGARGALGMLKTRKLKSAKFTKTLAGAPDGQYVVVQYSSSFELKKSATETVTPMLASDGTWKVSGYYIK